MILVRFHEIDFLPHFLLFWNQVKVFHFYLVSNDRPDAF